MERPRVKRISVITDKPIEEGMERPTRMEKIIFYSIMIPISIGIPIVILLLS